MVQTSGPGWTLAPAGGKLLAQLQARWPGQQWQHSPQTGTIGDQRHAAEGWTGSDHNPFTAPDGRILPVRAPGGLVRALDIAANVTGVAGIVDVTDAPDCEALFWMVQRMLADHDPRVWPYGYAIFKRRISDGGRPGEIRPTSADEDPHLFHLHISLGRNPAGFNSTAPWPLSGSQAPSSGPAVPIGPGTDTAHPVEEGMYEVLRNAESGAVRMGAVGQWRALDTPADVANALNGPLCTPRQYRDKEGKLAPRPVSGVGMQWWHDFYLNVGQ
jgi:hypothetical protein